MPLLIDGYNLLHISGILGRGRGPGGLEQSRTALLNFLAASIDPQELKNTTVVFDSNEAPWGLPKSLEHHGISVRFAAQYGSADEMIEELINADFAPRRLTVVSSDHEIQRAARRRRAKAVDSDVWFAELIRSRQERQQAEAETPARPPVPLLEEDVEYWFRQFGGETAFANLFAAEQAAKKPTAKRKHPASSKNKEEQFKSDKPNTLENPFPPGYADDLLGDM